MDIKALEKQLAKKVMREIERKFLVKVLPDLSGIKPIYYERYYLLRENGKEVRIQNKSGTFELETKIEKSDLERDTNKEVISKEEFESLKSGVVEADGIERESYLVSANPEISLKIYKGRFFGLIRAEIEFKDGVSAKSFEPLPWMDREITSSPLGRDSRLLDLTDEEFKSLLTQG